MTTSASSTSQTIHFAEKELGAFLRAVAHIFGPDEVQCASKLWMATLEQSCEPDPCTERFFRTISIRATNQLSRDLLSQARIAV
jgi:hypothetical protein